MPGSNNEETYWEMIDRQKGILDRDQQMLLKKSLITVIGCGGIGGAALEMLVRMGVEKVRIVDKDVFELTNINRQLMSNMKRIGTPKTEATIEELLSINPHLYIESFNEELTEHNVVKILKGSKIVIDALDNLLTRIIVSRCAREIEIPFIHGAIHGTMGQVSVFTNSTPSYEEIFKLPSQEEELTKKVISKVLDMNKEVPPAIGPVPNIVGCIQAFEALKLITGKGNPVMSPQVLMFDLWKEEAFSVVRF
ncbi:MAG: HesA/MoeB/ThiF family protein [Methanobacteriaceae archaeon]|nr:HesA/MoeB/ThiF family protein [Methanobacteriaceae archaeon]